MSQKINDSQKSVFLDYLSEIERNKIGPLSGELTYKKQQVDSFENYIATQLFNENTKKLDLKDIEETIGFVKWGKHNLLELKQEIISDSFLSEDQKNFLVNNIDSVLIRMELVLKGVYIEAEKGGYKLDKQKRDALREQVQILCNQIRGPRVSDVPHEKFLVLKNIHDKFIEKKDVLSVSEQHKLDQFFKKFGISSYFDVIDKYGTPKNENPEDENSLKGYISVDKYVYVIKMILEKIYGIPCIIVCKGYDFRDGNGISENKYDEKEGLAFVRPDVDDYEINQFLESNNLSENFCINIDPNKKNLSAGAGKLNIPYIKDYKKMDISRFLRLMEHELKHVIRARKSTESLPINIDKKIDNITISEQDKGFKELDSTDLEEGITKFSEEAVSQNIEDMQVDVGIGHIATFIGENYGYKEGKELLKIYLKLDGKSEDIAEKQADTRIRRVKRFFPLDTPGAYGKDTLYYRSKKNIIELVQDCQTTGDSKRIEDLAKTAYIAKLGETDIEKYKDMLKSMTSQESYDSIPYEIGKIIYAKLSGESLKDVEKNDIRFSINKLSAQQKKALVEILKYTKESLEK